MLWTLFRRRHYTHAICRIKKQLRAFGNFGGTLLNDCFLAEWFFAEQVCDSKQNRNTLEDDDFPYLVDLPAD
jgi:hypothetical protein